MDILKCIFFLSWIASTIDSLVIGEWFSLCWFYCARLPKKLTQAEEPAGESATLVNDNIACFLGFFSYRICMNMHHVLFTFLLYQLGFTWLLDAGWESMTLGWWPTLCIKHNFSCRSQHELNLSIVHYLMLYGVLYIYTHTYHIISYHVIYHISYIIYHISYIISYHMHIKF